MKIIDTIVILLDVDDSRSIKAFFRIIIRFVVRIVIFAFRR
jgi:hypothetical protein